MAAQRLYTDNFICIKLPLSPVNQTSVLSFFNMTAFQNNPKILVSYRTGEKYAFEHIYRYYLDDIIVIIRRGGYLQ